MELVSGCVECGLAEPESLASLGGSAPGVVDGILSGGKGYCQKRIVVGSQKKNETRGVVDLSGVRTRQPTRNRA